MLRLFVLLTAVICCNACRFEMFPEDTTSSPEGCVDSEGNLHGFDTDWEEGHETCVCVDLGSICCQRFDHWGLIDHDYHGGHDHEDSTAQPNTDDHDDQHTAEEVIEILK